MEEDIKTVQVVKKIDSEFIIELYKKALEKKGEERMKLIRQAFTLSNHIGKYLTIKV
tara:strand:- start:51 stop:221 length:171 start_codon:yes stop_codon:yes gene_type:complete